MKSISIIRDRGQITIPDNIRKKIEWANPMHPITISIVSPQEISIKPHRIQADRAKVFEEMARIRSFRGNGKTISASEFLETDRKSH
jgi:bifunctional DNA-binding transcriptional regulator/antitoxin component of YhaV-PrlF toxin-antitoxin module